MSVLEAPSQEQWDLEAHRIRIPPTAGPNQFASTSTSSSSASLDAEQGGFFYIPNFITEDEERFLSESILSAPKPKWKMLQNRRLQEWGGQIHAKNNTLMPQAMPDFLRTYPDLVTRLRNTHAFDAAQHGEPNHCLVNEYLAGQGIMPHEDGPAYFPAVATISLGSHTLLDIYRYVDEDLQKDFDERMKEHDQKTTQQSSTGTEGCADGSTKSPIVPKERVEGNVRIVRGARAREPSPVFSILQEPRSLLITTGDVYKSYLHGIAERTVDTPAHLAHVVNAELLSDPRLRAAVEEAKKNVGSDSQDAEGLERETRLSLTFRDVEKVSKGVAESVSLISKDTSDREKVICRLSLHCRSNSISRACWWRSADSELCGSV
jgi:alkylated DNA repair protein alkB family protein 6